MKWEGDGYRLKGLLTMEELYDFMRRGPFLRSQYDIYSPDRFVEFPINAVSPQVRFDRYSNDLSKFNMWFPSGSVYLIEPDQEWIVIVGHVFVQQWFIDNGLEFELIGDGSGENE